MYRCNYCPKSYVWEDSLSRHIKNKHTAIQPMQYSEELTMARPTGMDQAGQALHISRKPITFQHPFTMTMSGPTGSGKTMLLKELLRKDKIIPSPDRIVYLYKRWQHLYDEMQETIPNIEFIRGIPDDLDEDAFFDVKKNNVIICDDMMSVAAVDPKIADLYTEGSHHRNLSVINLTQSLFPPGKNAVTQRRNTQYMIVFKSPMSQDQIRTLGTFMFPGRLDEFLQLYDEAVEKPYGYLIIDAKQTTPNEERFKTDIFTSNNPDEEELNTCEITSDVICRHDVSDGVRFYCDNCKYKHENETIFDSHTCGEAFEADIKGESTSNTDHSDMNLSQDNMADNTYPCAECGALYNTPGMLFKHIKQCGGNNDETDVWKRMLEEVFEDNEEEFNRKMEEYAEHDDAVERAKRDMRDVYKRELKNLFKRYFIFAQLLEKNDMYDQILEDFNTLQFEKQYDREKALKAAIRKNDAIFEQVLDEYSDSDDETEEEESDIDE